ncbi:hypothetical protein ECANGB1_1739 [Enterospora canceri]|uniref:Uncharacterized protein n=1 Tax=Enterospora canceri TaxID=1081671 RepID=A0A1Y1S5J8_9MICR|nr:hypothetical protein ECANGB1_1739 [Enterospora canceri]
MKFVFEDCDEGRQFETKMVNGRYILENKEGEIVRKATETNSPVDYCACEIVGDRLRIGEEEACLMRIETEMEGSSLTAAGESVEYEQMVAEFGDRRAKEAVKKRAIERKPAAQRVKFNLESNVVSERASCLVELFEKEVTDKSKEIVNALGDQGICEEICEKMGLPGVEAVSVDEVVVFEKRCILVLIDYVNTILTTRVVSKFGLPEKYVGLYPIIAQDVVGRRLSRILADKLASKLYLMMLLYCNNKMSIEVLPQQNYTRTKFRNMIRALGCTISKGGIVEYKLS